MSLQQSRSAVQAAVHEMEKSILEVNKEFRVKPFWKERKSLFYKATLPGTKIQAWFSQANTHASLVADI